MTRANILIGREQDKEDSRFYQDCFSLFIDDKLTFVSNSLNGSFNYQRICEETADMWADTMIRENIRDYLITNGFKIDRKTQQKIPCEKMPEDGIKIFEQTLVDRVSVLFDE